MLLHQAQNLSTKWASSKTTSIMMRTMMNHSSRTWCLSERCSLMRLISSEQWVSFSFMTLVRLARDRCCVVAWYRRSRPSRSQ